MLDDVRPPKPRQKPTPRNTTAAPATKQNREERLGFNAPEPIARTTAYQPPKLIEHHADKPTGLRRFIPRTKLQRALAGAALIVIAIGLGASWTLLHHRRTVEAVVPRAVKKAAAPKLIYSNLSGLPVSDASVNQKPVTAVMVENSIDARPQSGLGDAGVVFEAVAEGGVTRFLALYQDTAPGTVGPIRSARPYYVSWALGFQAAYAHVGGSDDALNDIKAWGVQDMNQFYNGNSYHRVSNRAAPHNVYTGIGTLNQLEASKGYHSSFTGFRRKSDAPSNQTGAHTINLSLSGYTYDPQYTYNPSTNSYDRAEAGTPQLDANNDKQLSPKVVIAMVVPESQGALDSSGAYYSNYNPVGSGQAYMFQDGTVTPVTWAKAGNNAALTFQTSAGQPVTFNRGQTWITAVTATNKVSYK